MNLWTCLAQHDLAEVFSPESRVYLLADPLGSHEDFCPRHCYEWTFARCGRCGEDRQERQQDRVTVASLLSSSPVCCFVDGWPQ